MNTYEEQLRQLAADIDPNHLSILLARYGGRPLRDVLLRAGEIEIGRTEGFMIEKLHKGLVRGSGSLLAGVRGRAKMRGGNLELTVEIPWHGVFLDSGTRPGLRAESSTYAKRRPHRVRFYSKMKWRWGLEWAIWEAMRIHALECFVKSMKED